MSAASSAIIREVHSYGRVAPIGKKIRETSQHRGFGKKLIEEAERIVRKDFGLKELRVIAAEGTREYYKKLGFLERGLYLGKGLNK